MEELWVNSDLTNKSENKRWAHLSILRVICSLCNCGGLSLGRCVSSCPQAACDVLGGVFPEQASAGGGFLVISCAKELVTLIWEMSGTMIIWEMSGRVLLGIWKQILLQCPFISGVIASCQPPFPTKAAVQGTQLLWQWSSRTLGGGIKGGWLPAGPWKRKWSKLEKFRTQSLFRVEMSNEGGRWPDVCSPVHHPGLVSLKNGTPAPALRGLFDLLGELHPKRAQNYASEIAVLSFQAQPCVPLTDNSSLFKYGEPSYVLRSPSCLLATFSSGALLCLDQKRSTSLSWFVSFCTSWIRHFRGFFFPHLYLVYLNLL